MSFMDFSPPSYRAASSDLTISVSPLGLVELADEEFEVHGPRLNRYSLNWAMYLGHTGVTVVSLAKCNLRLITTVHSTTF
jgi:hypothetical protein